MPKNEVAADNQRRRMEEISKSPVGGIVDTAVSLARPALALGSAVIATGASAGSGLPIAGGVVAGLGIVDWFRKLGTAKVNENLEALGQATEDALNGVEKILREQGTSIGEIKARIESQEFVDGMASAARQALRTTQKDRLRRMGLILANGIKENDLNSESIDDLMRAAVELNDGDIELLKAIYDKQIGLLQDGRYQSSEWSQQVKNNWSMHFAHLDGQRYLATRSSLARLQSLGFIVAVETMMSRNGSISHQPFGLVREGAKFYERLRENAT